MNQISEAVTAVFGVVMIAAVAFEIRRRRQKLRDLYDVLGAEEKHVAAELEAMIAAGAIHPHTEEMLAW
jgi:cytosine/uracil/thiamine/allantoin permease